MILFRKYFFVLLSLALCWLAAPAAFAAEMVSAAVGTLHMRAGPGTGYQARWTVDKGYPFKVIGRKGKWVKVSDFERDTGWVYGPMTNKKPHRVVRPATVNLRSQPNLRSAVVARAVRGDVLRTLRHRGSWIQVRRDRGPAGWMRKSQAWGW
ncbi:SH3 domain-containing protein [Variovorax sp. PAMC 28711]|uniref:SH3 domain-containing protein n=1 Tax=Variovorax sp. PAMC 28711 TaxID=1795631 RepID=UPI00078E1E1E|nr:SH3 domain-containing protein [Variovorax sp. PAMC 28711]AMM26317.1 peptide-binding protein [Variovorax sp. PAMC 28711]